MKNEQNTTMTATRSTQPLQRVPGFDPLFYVREAVDQAGETVLTMDLKHKKKWFRTACPSGGMVLNPLRVTDQMAIFEARVFADKDDRNPMASFTAVRTADKATGRQYIQTAQDDELSAALDNAGFGIPLIDGISRISGSESGPTAPASTSAAGHNPAVGDDKPVTPPAPPADILRQAAPPAPAGTADVRPAPVAPLPHNTAVNATAAHKDAPPTVVDIAAHQPAADPLPDAQAGTAPDPKPEAGEAPVKFTADMEVAQICPLMTLEYARGVLAPSGIRKGWTLGQVADDAPVSLKWYRFVCPDADNVAKAACQLLLDDLTRKEALKKAG